MMDNTEAVEVKETRKTQNVTAQLLVGSYWHEISYVEGASVAETVAKVEADYAFVPGGRTFKADGAELAANDKMPLAEKFELIGIRADA